MPRLTLLFLVAGLLLLAACDGDGAAPATPTATTAAAITPTVVAPSASPTSPPEATAPASPTPFEGTRGPVEGRLGFSYPAGFEPLGVLMDVRTGRHEGFDRIVFEFTGYPPDYRVEYVSWPVTECGSGRTVEIAGDAFLEVRFSPAAAHDPDTGAVTFEPQELTPGLPALVEAKSTCDFEGVLTWVVGLAEELDFRVTELRDPPQRLVIDVAHPAAD